MKSLMDKYHVAGQKAADNIGFVLKKQPTQCQLPVIGIFLLMMIQFIPAILTAQQQTIKVGLPSVPPVIFRDENGIPQGFQIVILSQIAQSEGWTLEFVDGSWSECYELFLKGEIDLLPALTRTPEREVIFDFIDEPFYKKWTTVYIHSDDSFHTVTQFKNKRIGLMKKDQNAESFIKFISPYNINWTPVWFNTHDEAFEALHRKEIDAAVCYADEKSNYESFRNAKCTGIAIDPLLSSIGFQKGKNEQARLTINKYLEQYKADPNSTFNILLDKPLHLIQQQQPKMPDWVLWSYLLFVLTLVVLLAISLITRRAISKAHKALKTTKTMYQTMVDNLTVALAIFHLSLDDEENLIDATYLSANPQYFQTVRIKKKNMAGRSFRQEHGEERFADWSAIMKDVYQKGKPVEFELQDRQTKHWFAGRAVRFDKEKVAVLCHDITMEKKEVHQLEQSENKFRRFFERMKDGVLILNHQKHNNTFSVLDSNPALHNTFSLSNEPNDLQEFLEAIETDDKDFIAKLCNALTRNVISEKQFTLEIKAQSYRVHCLSIHEDVLGLIFVNITEELAKQLLKSNVPDSLTPFLNFSHECLVYINNDFKIDWANYQALQYCGKKLSQIKDLSFEGIFGERRTLNATTPVQEAYTSKSTISRDDFTLSNGHTLSISVIPQIGVAGNIDHLLMAFVDITELRMREEQQLQLQKMEILGHLSGGIAHDFNNILQAVLGFSDLLKQRFKDNPLLYKNAQAISDAGNHGAKLVKQLMGFTRKEKAEPTLIDINEQLKNLMKMLQRIIGENVTLELKTTTDKLLIHADPNQLDQTVINLCINARDAISHHDGHIILQTGVVNKLIKNKTRKTVYLSVKDNGAGVPEDQRDKIFDPFYTTKEKGKGTGLGLASVQEIVNHHNGLIELESEIDVGSTFTLFFPTQDESSSLEANPQLAEPEKTVSNPAKLTILLAEDNERAAIFTKTILEEMGNVVHLATNGRKAVQLYSQHHQEIDLLFFDLIMPELTGRQAYHEIRKTSPDIPIIFCSGYDQNELPEEYLDEIGALFLPKPFRTKELKNAIYQITLKIEKGNAE